MGRCILSTRVAGESALEIKTMRGEMDRVSPIYLAAITSIMSL
jgi:hypothetical protein